MAISIIEQQHIDQYLGTQTKAFAVRNPDLYKITASLVDHLQATQKTQHPQLHVPAYYYDDPSTEDDCLTQMTDNGHYVPFLAKDPNSPRASQESIDRLVKRAKKNFLIFHHLTVEGLPAFKEEVDMYNELGDWYEGFKESKNPRDIYKTGPIVEGHINTLYQNIEPHMGTKRDDDSTQWVRVHNGALAVSEEIDNWALQLTTFGEEFFAKEAEIRAHTLLGDMKMYAGPKRQREYYFVGIIRAYRALGLVDKDFGAKEEAEVKENGFLPFWMK